MLPLTHRPFLGHLSRNSFAGLAVSLMPVLRRLLSAAMAPKTALMIMADGSEEMEAVITTDILRRGKINVTVASIASDKMVKCSRDVKVEADSQFQDIESQTFDVVILPGGLAGSNALACHAGVGKLLLEQERANRKIAAICAAPSVLKAHKICRGRKLTCYPTIKDQLINDYKYVDDTVVVDGSLITSKGPATAFHFALTIVESLVGKTVAVDVADALLFKEYV